MMPAKYENKPIGEEAACAGGSRGWFVQSLELSTLGPSILHQSMPHLVRYLPNDRIVIGQYLATSTPAQQYLLRGSGQFQFGTIWKHIAI
jgi:hypothetical protein